MAGGPGTVAFDIIGTMFTLDRLRDALTSRGAPEGALELWFAQSLRDAFALAHAGGYRPLKQVLEASLERLAGALELDASTEDLRRVVGAFAELDPHPDAEEACRTFVDAGWKVLALTNGSEDGTRALLERSGLLRHFSGLLSCDAVQTTKPHPEVYAMAKKEASGDLWLVAAHAWDVAGAVRAGLRTAWVSRLEGSYLAVYPEPDIQAPDLRTAARLVTSAQR